MDYDNMGPCQIQETTAPRASRDHECEECLGKISKGERYEHTSQLYDGSWHHSRRCTDCRVLCAEIDADLAPHGCVSFGELYEELIPLEDYDPRRQRFADICRKRGSRWKHWEEDFDVRSIEEEK